jgi:hypothetical protein
MMGRACSREKREAYRDLVCTSEGKRLFGSPNYRCENNIKMDPNDT